MLDIGYSACSAGTPLSVVREHDTPLAIGTDNLLRDCPPTGDLRPQLHLRAAAGTNRVAIRVFGRLRNAGGLVCRISGGGVASGQIPPPNCAGLELPLPDQRPSGTSILAPPYNKESSAGRKWPLATEGTENPPEPPNPTDLCLHLITWRNKGLWGWVGSRV